MPLRSRKEILQKENNEKGQSRVNCLRGNGLRRLALHVLLSRLAALGPVTRDGCSAAISHDASLVLDDGRLLELLLRLRVALEKLRTVSRLFEMLADDTPLARDRCCAAGMRAPVLLTTMNSVLVLCEI